MQLSSILRETRHLPLFLIWLNVEASLAMMFGPECCSVLEKREVAGMAMSAIMVTGILEAELGNDDGKICVLCLVLARQCPKAWFQNM